MCGPQIGLTPTMGWNSWNCFAGSVTEEKVKAAADTMVAKGLINHGYTYINIDDFWEVNPGRGEKRPHAGAVRSVMRKAACWPIPVFRI